MKTAPIGGLVLIAGVMGKLGVFFGLTTAAPLFAGLFASAQVFFLGCLLGFNNLFGALLALRADSWRGVLAFSFAVALRLCCVGDSRGRSLRSRCYDAEQQCVSYTWLDTALQLL